MSVAGALAHHRLDREHLAVGQLESDLHAVARAQRRRADQHHVGAAGLESVFGQGMFTAGVLSRLPAEWFGPESIRRYAVRFRKRVWPGDSIVCRGRVTRVYDEGGVPHADLALTARNQKDEVLVRGEATVRPWRPGAP